MTQAQTGATFWKGRLLRSAAVSAFALSALAGGVVLSGDKANACNATLTTFGDTDTCTVNGYTDQITLLSPIITGSTNNFRALPQPGNYDTTFDWDGNGAKKSGTTIFQLTKTPSKAWFDRVQFRLQPNVDNDQSGTKTIYSAYDPLTQTLSGQIAQIVIPTGGTIGSVSLPNQYNTIYVKDDFTNATHANNDFHNTPGPLPILGAGAAFGFSRKLRGRIKAASNV